MGGVSGKMVQERAVAGDVRGLEELLKSQAEGQAELASWVENESYSVLMAVAEKNMNNNAEKVVKTLAKYGADLDYISPKREETALMIATKANNVSVADQLVKCGANPSLRNKRKKTALDIAKNAAIKTILSRAASSWGGQKKTTGAADVSDTSTQGSGSSQKYVSSANRRNRQSVGGISGNNDEDVSGCLSSCVCDVAWINILSMCESTSPESYDESNAVLDNSANRRYRYQGNGKKDTTNDRGSSIGKKIGFYGGTEENSKATARSTENFYRGPIEDDEDNLTEDETNESVPYQGNDYDQRGDLESRVQQLEEQLEKLQQTNSKQERKIGALQEQIKLDVRYSTTKGHSNLPSISNLFDKLSCLKSSAIPNQETVKIMPPRKR